MNLKCRILFGILFCLILVPGFSMDIPITYDPIPEQMDMVFRPQGWGYFERPLLDPPSGDWKMPKFTFKYPIYALLKLGDTQRLVILDFQNSSDLFYNRLYFDANNNKDLTDDPVIQSIRANTSSNYYSTNFPLIETSYELNGKTLPYRFAVSLGFYNRFPENRESSFTKENLQNSMNMTYRVQCYYKGSFQLEDVTYNFAISDSNGNGRFNDTASVPEYAFTSQPMRNPIHPGGDYIYLKSQAKGNLSWDDDQILTSKIILNNKLYDLAIDESKSLMTLVPSQESVYQVNLPMDIDRITFYKKDAKSSIGVYNSSRIFGLPSGEYIFLSYTAFRKEQKGGQWILKAGATKDTPWFTVDGEGTKEIVLGEPYTPVVEIPEWSRQQLASSPVKQVQLSFNVEGKGKELLSNLSNLSGSLSDIPASSKYTNRPKEPGYTITKTGGAIVAQGTFEYG